MFSKLVKEKHLPKTHIPEPPKVSPTANYGSIKIDDYLSLEDLLSHIKSIESKEPKHMELLNIGPNYGQNFGFILYRIITQKFKNLDLLGKLITLSTVFVL